MTDLIATKDPVDFIQTVLQSRSPGEKMSQMVIHGNEAYPAVKVAQADKTNESTIMQVVSTLSAVFNVY